jgi:hypothetical protein
VPNFRPIIKKYEMELVEMRHEYQKLELECMSTFLSNTTDPTYLLLNGQENFTFSFLNK